MEPHTYEHFSDMSYEKNKFNFQRHFREHTTGMTTHSIVIWEIPCRLICFQTLGNNILLPSSGSKYMPSKCQAFSKADCPACSLLGLFFNLEDGGTIFLQNISEFCLLCKLYISQCLSATFQCIPRFSLSWKIISFISSAFISFYLFSILLLHLTISPDSSLPSLHSLLYINRVWPQICNHHTKGWHSEHVTNVDGEKHSFAFKCV